ncbi:MAG: hypothetical protein ABI885_27095 [Gammaproteobacteria bacterium]
METVTVAASRGGFALSGAVLTIVSVIVFAAIAVAVVTSLKHLRNRHPHRGV